MRRVLRGSLALLFLANGARADDGGSQAQFDYGLAEMTAGRFTTGCPALAASFHGDPRPGTLFTLAECQLKWGHTASALATYQQYLDVYERMTAEDKAKQQARSRIATLERTELQTAVPRLSLHILPGPNPPDGAFVTLDDQKLDAVALSSAFPVDPGEHVVRLTLADGRAKEQHVTLANGEQRTLPLEPPDYVAPTASIVPPPTPEPTPRASHRGLTFAALGVGGAGLVVSAVMGALALSKKSTASSDCMGAVCTSQAGADAGNDARTFANVETVSLIVTGVGLAAAAVLFFTEPSKGAPKNASLFLSPTGPAVRW